MADTLWKNDNGQLIVNDAGKLVLCESCPCGDVTCNTMFTVTMSCNVPACANNMILPAYGRLDLNWVSNDDLYLQNVKVTATNVPSITLFDEIQSTEDDHRYIGIFLHANMVNVCANGTTSTTKHICVDVEHVPDDPSATPIELTNENLCYTLEQPVSSLIPCVTCGGTLTVAPSTGQYAFWRYTKDLRITGGTWTLDSNWKREAIFSNGEWYAVVANGTTSVAPDGLYLGDYGHPTLNFPHGGNIYAPMKTPYIGVPATFDFAMNQDTDTGLPINPVTLNCLYVKGAGDDDSITVYILQVDDIDTVPKYITEDQLGYATVSATMSVTTNRVNGIQQCVDSEFA